MKRLRILPFVLLAFNISYSQEIYIDTVKRLYYNEGVTELIYENYLNKKDKYIAYGIINNNLITFFTESNSRINFNYDNKKLKEIYHKEHLYFNGQYISFHKNGVIDSIGNYEPYNESFKQRIKCDTVWHTNTMYSIDCTKGFQDKDWFFFDKKGKLYMIKTYDKGVLVRKIIVPEPK